MRWKAAIKPSYKVGSIHSVIRFAWIPKHVGDFVIWLQRYETVYTYTLQQVKAEVSTAEAREFNIYSWTKLLDREI